MAKIYYYWTIQGTTYTEGEDSTPLHRVLDLKLLLWS